MLQQQGPATLWRGLLPTMLRDVPFSGNCLLYAKDRVVGVCNRFAKIIAIYWMGYERIKHRLTSGTQQDTLSSFQTSFIAGASSGMVRYHDAISR